MLDPRGDRSAPRCAATLALALALAGCAQDITVHVRAGDRPPDPDHASGVVVGTAALVGGVAVDRVQLALRNLKLQVNPTPDGSPALEDRAVSPPLVIVDLSGAQLAPGALTEIVGRRHLSWSSFYQTVMELRPLGAEETADPALVGWTVVITGRLPGGAPFTYRSAAASVLVRPAVFRGGLNHNNLTVNIAPNRWFEGPAGAPLDPLDPASASSIEANILQSIDAYMDDNRDGNPDFLG
jgi:hypothetical protein